MSERSQSAREIDLAGADARPTYSDVEPVDGADAGYGEEYAQMAPPGPGAGCGSRPSSCHCSVWLTPPI